MAIARLGKDHYHTNRPRWRRYCYLRRVLQVYWLPTLQKILAALRPSSSQDVPNATEKARLQELLKLWKDLGRAFNLSEKSRDDDTGLTSYVTPEELNLGCFFDECLCYGEKPLHGIRRVCQGCWSVYYCGKRCQKKDWKAGHKDICRGRAVPTPSVPSPKLPSLSLSASHSVHMDLDNVHPHLEDIYPDPDYAILPDIDDTHPDLDYGLHPDLD
ncbi:hypothetical protein BC629DRAFT_45019 [Irpex lacteus]|nr:hypothetical protein BC629DRAFT_45019 [Irpex lacteus]